VAGTPLQLGEDEILREKTAVGRVFVGSREGPASKLIFKDWKKEALKIKELPWRSGLTVSLWEAPKRLKGHKMDQVKITEALAQEGERTFTTRKLPQGIHVGS